MANTIIKETNFRTSMKSLKFKEIREIFERQGGKDGSIWIENLIDGINREYPVLTAVITPDKEQAAVMEDENDLFELLFKKKLGILVAKAMQPEQPYFIMAFEGEGIDTMRHYAEFLMDMSRSFGKAYRYGMLGEIIPNIVEAGGKMESITGDYEAIAESMSVEHGKKLDGHLLIGIRTEGDVLIGCFRKNPDGTYRGIRANFGKYSKSSVINAGNAIGCDGNAVWESLQR